MYFVRPDALEAINKTLQCYYFKLRRKHVVVKKYVLYMRHCLMFFLVGLPIATTDFNSNANTTTSTTTTTAEL